MILHWKHVQMQTSTMRKARQRVQTPSTIKSRQRIQTPSTRKSRQRIQTPSARISRQGIQTSSTRKSRQRERVMKPNLTTTIRVIHFCTLLVSWSVSGLFCILKILFLRCFWSVIFFIFTCHYGWGHDNTSVFLRWSNHNNNADKNHANNYTNNIDNAINVTNNNATNNDNKNKEW